MWVNGTLNTQKLHHQVKGIDENIKTYLAKIKEAKIGCINGAICHLYHGEFENRQYLQRYEILRKHNYIPSEDILKNEDGILCFTENGMRMENDIKNYFLSRKEY